MLVKINVTLLCNFLQWIAKICILYNNWINCFRLAQLVGVFGNWVFSHDWENIFQPAKMAPAYRKSIGYSEEQFGVFQPKGVAVVL